MSEVGKPLSTCIVHKAAIRSKKIFAMSNAYKKYISLWVVICLLISTAASQKLPEKETRFFEKANVMADIQ